MVLRQIVLLSVLVSLVIGAILFPPSNSMSSLHRGLIQNNPFKIPPYSVKKFNKYAHDLYKKIGLQGLTSLSTFKTCLIGYLNLKRNNLLKKDGLLVLIDYSQPSDRERFFVMDVKRGRLLYKSLVAHGKKSGDRFACGFSNTPGSYKSCLGFFITGQTYEGRHGQSLLLQGIEPGINDNAVKRRIVIHGADYVSRQFIKKYGRAGRSLGCPALPKGIAKPIIETIKGGSCLFIFGSDKIYFKKSRIINAKGAIRYFEKAGI